MITNLISILSEGKNISYNDILAIMSDILGGKISDEHTADFLKKLADKGETDEELSAMLDSMMQFAVKIRPQCKETLIDVCGTGGDKMSTFNISTTASFVIAASGGAVAKHGNRSVSGVSGSADIFEFFGYDLDSPPQTVTQIIEKFKIGFMFAQKFHPAMKNVVKARKLVGSRTAFNLLGPISNPAGVKNQLIGVFSEEYLQRLPSLLNKRGAENIMTVRSEDGLDELSTTSKNQICTLRNGIMKTEIVNPQHLGLKKGVLKEIQVSTKAEAISAFISVLKNSANNSMRDITILNAAGGLIVANLAENFPEGIEIAKDTIQSGKSFALFEDFVRGSGNMEKLKEFDES